MTETTLVDRIINNNLNDEDKEQLTTLVTPKIPYHKREEVRDRFKLRYKEDEDFRHKVQKQRLEYYYKKTADIEKKPKGRKILIYENAEERRRITNENMKAKYHEKTKDIPKQTRGRKNISLEEKIEKMTAKFYD